MALTSLGDKVLFLGDDRVFYNSASDFCVGIGKRVIYRDDVLCTLDDRVFFTWINVRFNLCLIF